jgi:hypothetical protein
MTEEQQSYSYHTDKAMKEITLHEYWLRCCPPGTEVVNIHTGILSHATGPAFLWGGQAKFFARHGTFAQRCKDWRPVLEGQKEKVGNA